MNEEDDLGSAYLVGVQEDDAQAALSWLQRRTAQPAQQEGAGFSLSGIPGAIGRTIKHTPRAVARGVMGAGNEVLGQLNRLADWLNENVADLRIDIPGLPEALGNPLAAAEKATKPDAYLSKPESAGGRMVEGAARFLTGFIPAVSALRGAGMGATASSILAGGISQALTTEQGEQNLAALIQSYPALQNPITEYLATDPNNPEAVNRLRHAIEGVGLGLMTEGVVRGIRALANMRGGGAQQTAASLADEAAAKTAEIRSTAVMLAPDDAPLTMRGKMAVDAKLRSAAQATDVSTVGSAPKPSAFNTVSPDDFVAARNKSTRQTMLSQGTPDELAKHQLFTNGDRTVGYAISPDGHLENVFNVGKVKGAGREAVEDAVQRGARTLDAFDGFLPNYYSKFGFEEVGRIRFVDEFAPKGWDFSMGRPDIVFMAHTGAKKPYAPTTVYFDDFDTAKRAAQAAAANARGTGALPGGAGVSAGVVPGQAAAGGSATTGAGPGAAGGGNRLGVPPEVVAKGIAGSADDAAMRAADQAGMGAVPTFIRAADNVDDGIYINFGRIRTSEDVKQVIDDTATAFRSHIEKAQRGVQSHEATKQLADAMGMSVDDVLRRRRGEVFNAETALAARRIWAASAENVLNLAKKAASPNAGPIDQWNAMRALTVHEAIQAEVLGARTEAARALNSWGIHAGIESGELVARQIADLMERAGGMGNVKALLSEVAKMQPGALATVARRSWMGIVGDAMRESIVMGHLWRPSTHIVNTVSNSIVAIQQAYERGVARQIGRLTGNEVIEAGEALAKTYGMVESLKDAFRLASKAFRTGQSSMGGSLSKYVEQHGAAISSQAIIEGRGLSASQRGALMGSGLGPAIDFIGTVTRIPGRFLGAADEFFKVIAYRSEVHAQAARHAAGEGLKGQAYLARVAELVNNPPEWLKLAAIDAAEYATFTNRPGAFARSIMAARNAGGNPIGSVGMTLLLPYIRTPANILTYTFERSPLAPVMSSFWRDMAAGGAPAHLAVARMATGTALLATAFDMADAGLITGGGPANPARRQALMATGWQPWSFKIGNKYYSYNRLDPIAMPFAVAAEVTEWARRNEVSDEDLEPVDKTVAAALGAIAAAVTDKTFFTGVANVVEAIQAAGRDQDNYVWATINRLAAGAVPFESLGRQIKEFTDPVQRERASLWEYIMGQTPGLSQDLPPRRDTWGRTIKPDDTFGRAWEALSPFKVREEKQSPIDTELVRLNSGVSKPNKTMQFKGVKVDFRKFPDAYARYLQLRGGGDTDESGNVVGVKLDLRYAPSDPRRLDSPNALTLKQYLDALVQGQHADSAHYGALPDDRKIDFIRRAVRNYTIAAQDALLAEAPEKFPAFWAAINSKLERREERRALPPDLPTLERERPPRRRRETSLTGFTAG